MKLKKYLISPDKQLKAQAVLEYVIIFVVIALLASGFIAKASGTDGNGALDTHFKTMVNQMLK